MNKEKETRRFSILYKRYINLRPSALSPDKGFTLLELIVVIFVLSVVLALVLPSFTGIGEGRISSEAKRLASVIRYLNDSAISTKEYFQMSIDFTDKVVKYNGPDGERTERFDDISSVELQSKGSVSAGNVTVFFSPLGANESFRIHLKDDKSGMEVSFNAMSGMVKIETTAE